MSATKSSGVIRTSLDGVAKLDSKMSVRVEILSCHRDIDSRKPHDRHTTNHFSHQQLAPVCCSNILPESHAIYVGLDSFTDQDGLSMYIVSKPSRRVRLSPHRCGTVRAFLRFVSPTKKRRTKRNASTVWGSLVSFNVNGSGGCQAISCF